MNRFEEYLEEKDYLRVKGFDEKYDPSHWFEKRICNKIYEIAKIKITKKNNSIYEIRIIIFGMYKYSFNMDSISFIQEDFELLIKSLVAKITMDIYDDIKKIKFD